MCSRPALLIFLSGTPAADIIACLPEDTLSGIVYIASFFGMQFIPVFLLPFAVQQVSVMISAEASTEAQRDAILRFSDAIFDTYSDCNPYSPADAHVRQLRRWEVQSKWLGYGVHQSTADRNNVAMRQNDTGPLFALGKKGFPVLIVHGTGDAIVDPVKEVEEGKKYFTNLTVALIEPEDGGNHAPFHENPNLVMEHIGSFVKKVITVSSGTL